MLLDIPKGKRLIYEKVLRDLCSNEYFLFSILDFHGSFFVVCSSGYYLYTMFGRKALPEIPKTHMTIIGKSVTIDGTFVADEDVEFFGKMMGSMKVHGTLYIRTDAEVRGDIEAFNIMIDGSVEGNCKATADVHILSRGSVKGDVFVGNQFIVTPGATFLGSSSMLEKADVEFVDKKDDLDDEFDLDDL